MSFWQEWFKKSDKPLVFDVAALDQYLSNLTLSKYKNNIEDISMLYTVIGKRAEYCSQVKFTHKINGKVKENSDIIKLINNPNIYQTFKEFIYQYIFNLSLYGSAYIESIIPIGFKFNKAQLINLDNKYLDVPKWGYNELKSEKEIEDYIYKYDGGEERINSDNIITNIDDTQKSTNFLKGTSKTKAGKLIFDNSQLRLEADNILTDKPGGIGILSTANKEMNGVTIPLSEPEKEALHKKLKGYGVSKGKRNIILSSASLNYTALANPLKDWELSKNTERDFVLAASIFGQPKEFYMANAKYNDKVAAEIKYYSGDPLSTMQSFANTLLKYFKIEGEIEASYDHVPIMQEKRKERADYLTRYFGALKIAKELGADENLIKNLIEDEL